MDKTRSFMGISFLIGVLPPSPPVYKSIGPVTTVHLGAASSANLHCFVRLVDLSLGSILRLVVELVETQLDGFWREK